MRVPSILLAVVLLAQLTPCVSADSEQENLNSLDNPTAPAKPVPEQKPTEPPNETAAAPVQSPETTPPVKAPSSISGAPPSEVAEVSRDVQQLVLSGKQTDARALLNAALELHPHDASLEAAAKMLNKQDLHEQAPQRVAQSEQKILDSLNMRRNAGRLEFYVPGEVLNLFKGADSSQEPQLASVLHGPVGASGNAAIGRADAVATAGSAQSRASTAFSGAWTQNFRQAMSVGDASGALATIQAQLADHPGNEGLLSLRASVLMGARRYSEAEQQARALLARSESSWMRRVLADALLAQGRSAEALVQAHRAVALDPHDAKARVTRGEIYLALGQDKSGLNDLYVAAKLDPAYEKMFREQLGAVAAQHRGPDRTQKALWGLILVLLAVVARQLWRLLIARREQQAAAAVPNSLTSLLPDVEAAPAGYEVKKLLGAGGMGKVYLARDLRLDRPVAIKRLRPELASSPRERERFINEARMVAGLKHPNIMQVFEVGVDGPGVFLALEYIPGCSLAEDLDGRALQPLEAIGVLRGIAAALDFAHEQGVIHQDLKPTNVMRAGLEIKVVDFGIARHVEEVLATLSHARGTPAYMAPEQELRAAPRPAADIWSLGAVAYEILTGKRAFGGSLDAKRARLYRPATQMLPSLPEAVDPVISKCLDPDPEKRWSSAGHFVRELAVALKQPVG